MTDDLLAADESNTALSREGQPDLIPSLSTRAELNEAERAKIHAARIWALRPRTPKRIDLLTDAFAREPHKRMFNQRWRSAGCYRQAEKIPDGRHPASPKACEILSTMRERGWNFPPTHSTKRSCVSTINWFSSIPRPNGNGRHSPLIADVVITAAKSVRHRLVKRTVVLRLVWLRHRQGLPKRRHSLICTLPAKVSAVFRARSPRTPRWLPRWSYWESTETRPGRRAASGAAGSSEP